MSLLLLWVLSRYSTTQILFLTLPSEPDLYRLLISINSDERRHRPSSVTMACMLPRARFGHDNRQLAISTIILLWWYNKPRVIHLILLVLRGHWGLAGVYRWPRQPTPCSNRGCGAGAGLVDQAYSIGVVLNVVAVVVVIVIRNSSSKRVGRGDGEEASYVKGVWLWARCCEVVWCFIMLIILQKQEKKEYFSNSILCITRQLVDNYSTISRQFLDNY